MKKLQNNFTTPEQSKRLLELGVPADSADCYYGFKGKEIFVRHNKKQKSGKIFKPIYIPERKAPYVCIPCWSVGRLIEVIFICHIGKAAHIDFDKAIYDIGGILNIDWVIRVLESSVKCKHIDFSKLEE